MRKFSARWWVTPVLVQWRYMTACGNFEGPLWKMNTEEPARVTVGRASRPS